MAGFKILGFRLSFRQAEMMEFFIKAPDIKTGGGGYVIYGFLNTSTITLGV
jgi:hypothetical protein